MGLDYGINNSAGKPSREQSHEILAYAQEIGIPTLDTAEAYGNAIEVIGSYQQTHPPFQVISKFGHGDESLAEGVERSLKLLGMEYLHGYLYHKYEDLEGRPELIAELKALKAERKIDKVGVSIYTNDQFPAAIAAEHVDIIQLPFNLLDNWTLRGKWIAQAKAAGKEIHTRSVFLQGLFFMNPEELPAKLEPLRPALWQLHEFRQSAGFTVADLALNYVLSIPEIDGVLIGVDSVAQLKTNVAGIIEDFYEIWKQSIHDIKVNAPELLNPVNWK